MGSQSDRIPGYHLAQQNWHLGRKNRCMTVRKFNAMCRRATMLLTAWLVQPRLLARELGKGVALIPCALPICWNRTTTVRWMISIAVGLWLLMLSGCASEPGGRSLAETAAPVGIAATPALSPTPTFTPVPPPAAQVRAGSPPLASATPVPSMAEAESCPARIRPVPQPAL